tara:strand:+ start:567 stop:1313 length:747 start_codon:yes stop_codon:yes gene_type:complete
MKNKIFIVICCLFVHLYGQDVTLYRVNVEGNQTTSDKMIKYSAGLRDGTQIQRSDISTAVTRLWDLGLFEDINIVLNNESQFGVEVTIIVKETPILNKVLFKGMTVREGRFIEKIDLKPGKRIKPNSLEKAARKISEIYKEDGYFNVKVVPTIEVPTDTIVRTDYARDVLFTIEENRKFRLRNITFEGNDSFSDRKLKRELNNTKERKWWSFWVKSYDDKTFEEDKIELSNFYNNEGHRDFRFLKNHY